MNKNISITEEELHQIEQFLRGELSEENRVQFEARLAADSEWQEKLRHVQLINIGLKEAVVSEELKNIPLEKPTATIRSISHSRKKFFPYLAAAAVVGILFSILIFSGVFRDKNDRLFAEFYRPDAGLITAMSVTDKYDFEVAMVDYKFENYEAAIQKWEALAEKHGSNDTLSYFLGSAYLALDKVQEAIPYFEQVLKNTHGVFYHDAQWYYGLLLIKQGKTSDAIPYIAGSNHENKDKLLKRMRSR